MPKIPTDPIISKIMLYDNLSYFFLPDYVLKLNYWYLTLDNIHFINHGAIFGDILNAGSRKNKPLNNLNIWLYHVGDSRSYLRKDWREDVYGNKHLKPVFEHRDCPRMVPPIKVRYPKCMHRCSSLKVLLIYNCWTN